MSASAVDNVRELANAAAADAGLVVEDVTITGVGRRRVVKVIVDLPADQVAGVPMDAVAEASRVLSEELDRSEVLGSEPYLLEVTSPGISRPLTEPRHWMRARGRLVTVHRRSSSGGPITGRLVAVHDDGIGLMPAGADELRLPWLEIERGVVQIEFSDPFEKKDIKTPRGPSATAAGRRPSSDEEI